MIRPSLAFPSVRLALIAGLFAGVCGVAARAAAPSTQSNAYTKLVSDYMSGKWDDLQSDLKASSTQPSTFDPEQKAEVEYIRQTLAECRPWWWMRCKAGKRTQVKATIFNLPVTAMYDPQQKLGTNVHFTEDSTDVTVGWAFGDMDSDQPAEHGFSKGDLSNSGIWCTLGMTAGYLQVPFQSLINLSDADKVKLTRSLDCRGNMAAAYYSTPRSRRWWCFLSLQYYRPAYQASEIVMSRRALGAMFVEELVAHRAKYPSVQLPAAVDADNAEAKLALAVHDWIAKHEWTLAEDKSIREAIKAFALANQTLIRTGGLVQLPSGQQVSLDPAPDIGLRLKRDTWIVQKMAGE